MKAPWTLILQPLSGGLWPFVPKGWVLTCRWGIRGQACLSGDHGEGRSLLLALLGSLSCAPSRCGQDPRAPQEQEGRTSGRRQCKTTRVLTQPSAPLHPQEPLPWQPLPGAVTWEGPSVRLALPVLSGNKRSLKNSF